MKILSLTDYIDTPIPWICDDAGEQDVVMSSRIRIARNLTNAPFPACADPSQRETTLNAIQKAATAFPETMSQWFTPEDLSAQELNLALERRFATPHLLDHGKGTAFTISNDTTASLMANEEDHIRMQRFAAGLDLFSIWRKLVVWDEIFIDRLPIAYSEDLGFLTACPTNLGTGIRVSATLHLPALALIRQIDPILRGATKLGLTIRGNGGEGSDALGNMFQLSNQSTLGECEDDIMARVDHVARHLAWSERNARQQLLYNDPTTLYDYVGRAFGILNHARRMEANEAIDLLGALRLGIIMKQVANVPVQTVDKLMISIQPAHINYANRADTVQNEDITRAQILQNTLKHATFACEANL